MKKTQLVKFSLTLVSAAVLAACSSGGSKNAAAPVEPQPQPQPEQATQTPVEVYGLQQTKTFGNQFVKKNESDLIVDKAGLEEANNKSSATSLNMTLALHPSLDTIVLAERTLANGKKEIIYLEDFDFRDKQTSLYENGVHTLNNIHLDANGKTKASGVSEQRSDKFAATQDEDTADKPFESETKTHLKGKQTGRVLVLQDATVVNYVERSEKDLAVEKKKEADQQDASVAEVYGDRTFLVGTEGSVPAQANPLASNKETGDKQAPNAPLLMADGKPGVLKHIQYGRVTSRLNGVEDVNGSVEESLRPGVRSNGKVTYIASFGRFGDKGSENHYFYRTADQTRKAVDVKALKEANQEAANKPAANRAELTYRGHAVTYGLDHSKPHTQRVRGLPNAITNNIDRVKSGTHVTAKINLDTQLVSGRIYDTWTLNGEEKPFNSILVNFEGALNLENGAIQGNSELAYDETKTNTGSFKGNLFGTGNETELGGAVKSHVQTKKDWGAVFGLKQYVVGVEAEAPEAETPRRSGIVFTTDENSNL